MKKKKSVIVDAILRIIKSFSNQKGNKGSSFKVILDKESLKENLFFGSLPSYQLEPLEAILNELYRRDVEDIGIYAYVLATAYHETARFKYKEEIGKGKGKDYGSYHTIIRGNRQRYYGRGWAQITWLRNYSKMSIKCSRAFDEEVDLVSYPNKVYEDHRVNAFIICEGMLTGSFTGKNIYDYVDQFGPLDFVNARRVVNGTDNAQLIAGYANKFLEALNGT